MADHEIDEWEEDRAFLTLPGPSCRDVTEFTPIYLVTGARLYKLQNAMSEGNWEIEIEEVPDQDPEMYKNGLYKVQGQRSVCACTIRRRRAKN